MPELQEQFVITSVPKTPLKMLDVVALLVDKPEERLVTGQVGTVVESWRRMSMSLSSLIPKERQLR